MEHTEETFRKILRVASKVSRLSLGSLVWISAQHLDADDNSKKWDGYGFAIVDQYAYLNDEKILTLSEDELVEDAIEQINRFKLNSKKDIENRIKQLIAARDDFQQQQNDLSQRIADVDANIEELQQRLPTPAPTDDSID